LCYHVGDVFGYRLFRKRGSKLSISQAIMGQIKVSIITTVYTPERLKDISELLDSLAAQTYKNTETLVVAERSVELADSIKKYIADKGYPSMRVLFNEGEWGSYPSRNLAIGEARGDIIAFVDDDALPFPNWVEQTVKVYDEDSSVAGVTGPILPLWQDKSMKWFPRELYWIFSCTYREVAGRTEVRNGFCTNLSFRREAFDSCGRFKPSLVGGGWGRSDWQQPAAQETEFCLRVTRGIGKRIVYDPNVRVRHKVYGYRLSSGFLARRAYWEGYAKAMLNRWYRDDDGEVLATEYALLRRILLGRLPMTLGRLFRRPATAWRQLWVVMVVLSGVAGGYFSYKFLSLFRRGEPYSDG
jgi:glycosyltransferase involved in cell wall biosynthesis